MTPETSTADARMNDDHEKVSEIGAMELHGRVQTSMHDRPALRTKAAAHGSCKDSGDSSRNSNSARIPRRQNAVNNRRVLVVGAGFSGAVVAERLASYGIPVLVIDKRPHVGGNAYDTVDRHGVRIHPYGPHIF